MGIFQGRPEEPEQWAGLPAEPWQPRVPGEVLPPPVGDVGDALIMGTPTIALSMPTELTTVEVAIDAGGDGE